MRDYTAYELFIFKKLSSFYEPEDIRIMCRYIWVKDKVIYATNGKICVSIEFKPSDANDYAPEDGFYRFDSYDNEYLFQDDPAYVNDFPSDYSTDEVTEKQINESIVSIQKGMAKYDSMPPVASTALRFNPKYIKNIMDLSEIVGHASPKIRLVENGLYAMLDSQFFKIRAIVMAMREPND